MASEWQMVGKSEHRHTDRARLSQAPARNRASQKLHPMIQSTGTAATGRHLINRHHGLRRHDLVDSPTNARKAKQDGKTKTDDWFGDGTFKSVPSIFSQLYTIHCYTRSLVIPLVYILMTSRTKEVYAEVLRQLLVLKPDLNPKSIKIDFEQSFVSAFKQIFPNVHISGCFFHFGQCVWRKVQSTGLQKKYAEDSTFALHVKQLC
ncbi:Uncharacterized protein FWK35_00014072, partial [Aphis craccivora]